MTIPMYFARVRPALAALAMCAIFLVPATRGHAATPDPATHRPVPSLIRNMVGTWSVQQKMWPGPGAKPVALPPAIAHRRLVGGVFLRERMTLAPGSTQAPFHRIAYFNYNAINRQYEYVSLDTRAPQLMVEKSRSPGSETRRQAEVALYGDMFVAPRWGKFRNTAFRYRLVVGKVVEGRQVVKLYLTPLSGGHSGPFLAFQYIYTRIANEEQP